MSFKMKLKNRLKHKYDFKYFYEKSYDKWFNEKNKSLIDKLSDGIIHEMKNGILTIPMPVSLDATEVLVKKERTHLVVSVILPRQLKCSFEYTPRKEFIESFGLCSDLFVYQGVMKP